MTFFSLYARFAVYASIILAVISSGWYTYKKIDKHGYDRAVTEQAVIDSNSKETARLLTKLRQDQADKLQEEQNVKTEADRARIAALTYSLRNRPERPNPPSGNTKPAGNCTGAELYRPDGEFLTWYASEASRIKNALEKCEAQYGKLRDNNR